MELLDVNLEDYLSDLPSERLPLVRYHQRVNNY